MRSFSVFLVVAALAVTAVNSASLRSDNEKCGSVTICSSCGSLEGCSWCADGKGSCVPSDTRTCTNKVNNDYCVHEPCTKYSSCQTCLADAFCGWCGASGGCMEGEKMGPLTGSCPSWEYGRCSKDEVNPFVPSAKDTSPAGKEASDAMSQIEGVAAKLKDENKEAVKAEKGIVSADKQGGNIITKLKNFIAAWRKMADPEENSFIKARKEYQARLKKIMKKRRHSLDVIRTVLKEEFGDEVNEAKEVKGLLDEEEHAELLRIARDRSIAENTTSEAASAKVVETQNVEIPKALKKGDLTLGGIEHFVKKVTHKDKILMNNMHKIAENSVEQELHKAAVRKMAREEAAWYSCAWLLEKPSRSCADFHENYNGAQRQKDLTPEEHTRVCNEVQTRLNSVSKEKKTNNIK